MDAIRLLRGHGWTVDLVGPMSEFRANEPIHTYDVIDYMISVMDLRLEEKNSNGLFGQLGLLVE